MRLFIVRFASLSCLPLLSGCGLWTIDKDVAATPKEAWVAPTKALPKKPLTTSFAGPAYAGEPLSLYGLFNLALENSPKTRQAWEMAKISAAQYGVQKTTFLPTGGITAGIQRQNNQFEAVGAGGEQTIHGGGIDINWVLFTFGGREAELNSVRQALYAANFNYNQMLQDVALAVQQGYFNLNAAKAAVVAQLASLEDAEMTLKSAEIKFHAGLADLQQVLQSRADRESKRYLLQAAYADVETARANLAIAVGVPVQLSLDILPPADADYAVLGLEDQVTDLMAQALVDRPELLAAHAQWRSSVSHVQAAEKAIFPYLAAGFTASKYGGVDNTFQATQQSSFAIGLKWNIFDVFKDHYQVLGARSQAKAAEANLRQAELLVLGNVWTAFYGFKTSGKQLEAATAFLGAAEEAFKATRIGYNTGINSLVDLLNSQDTLASARLQKISSQATFSNSLAQLAHATGRLELKLPLNSRVSSADSITK